MTSLQGRQILVVEDEALVAAMAADMLEEAGASVVGPAVTLEEGLAHAQAADLDAALLDVNLRGKRVDPVAEALEARGVPFIFATGYGAAPEGRWSAAPMIEKPYAMEELTAALQLLIASRSA